ncbi:MAG: SUMF1/EgtB/PvdO family nonheme iron enzyme [Candidatus Latescibacteria bacterium]|nr:SUMF1/EgtB/PvdO family nonheme iron enzyme [Candidatus Latescibacterota bacterium]
MKQKEWLVFSLLVLLGSRGGAQEMILQLPGGAGVEMVWIEAGSFQMGWALDEDEEEDEDEINPADQQPQHQVTFSRGFWLGKFELTQGQWESVMETRPWEGQPSIDNAPDNPAVFLSWEDMQQFVGRVSQARGDSLVRLPTEAEWEYACRAGTTSRWAHGASPTRLRDFAWYSRNAWDVGERFPHPVGTRAANPWGLFDMHGNVWEWVGDWYGPEYYDESPLLDPKGPAQGLTRVVRGGGYESPAEEVEVTFRRSARPGAVSSLFGARLLFLGPMASSIEPETWGQVKSQRP